MALLSTLPSPRRCAALLALALWPTVASADEDKARVLKAADFYVRDLPGLPEDQTPVKMHAGHIEITPEHNGNLFFWHFENQHIADKQRTVIWLNGGPGCSSEDGALMEIGPYRVKGDKLVPNNGSWNEFANLLFVDNPVGTGFSFVDTNNYVHELDEMAEQFVKFLEEWFDIFPEYDQDDLYLAGESYAGQYIPYIAKAILDRKKGDSGVAWNLKGLLLGNAWISPSDQYDAYIKFALEKGVIKEHSATHQQLINDYRACQRRLANEPGLVGYQECEHVLNNLLKLTKSGSGNNACVNMYDVRYKDSYPSCGMNWPPDLKDIEPYLRETAVTKALHVSEKKNTGWSECVGAVGGAFTARKSKPSIDLLPDLLKKVPILLFSGAEDLICNHVGTETMISNMEWNGGKGFETTPGNWAPRRNWTYEGTNTGFWQEARNLTYVLFYESSHMVPFDLPRQSRDMLDRFMGVDISKIGGEPADSRIDGEKGPQTSVGSPSNNTKPEEDKPDEKLDEAKWAAYQRSGEIVLVIVIVAVLAWGYFLWRERRKRTNYHALAVNDSTSRFDRTKPGPGDLEAAAFDESELDDMPPAAGSAATAAEGSRYAVGGESESGVEDEKKQATHSS